MEAEAVEFFAHGQTRNTQPTGGFGLIALGKFDGAPKKFALQIVDRPRVNAVLPAALRVCERN